MISYRPLFNTMRRKNVTSYTLTVKMEFSRSKYQNIKSGNGCSFATLDELCQLLDCEVSDIIEYVPDDEVDNQKN